MSLARGVTSLLAGAALCASASTIATTSALAQEQKPNILFVMTDDVGWMTPGVYHGGLMVGDTPNIDRIGQEGVKFLDAYSEQSCTAGRNAFMAHLQSLGLTDLKVKPDPVQIATEAALWGSVAEQGLLDGTVIVSDGAGQFRIAEHALCWVHAERLIHKLDTFCEAHVQAKERIRARIWRLYRDLKAYRQAPTPRRARQLERRFNAIFSTETGFATLDRLLARLRANKDELLMVLKRPGIPLHTNGSENDIRCQVTRRKISGGTRSDDGRDVRDAFLGLMKTCAKQAISFWDYLGDRLGVAEASTVASLAELIRRHATA